jgi:hypothetical protein
MAGSETFRLLHDCGSAQSCDHWQERLISERIQALPWSPPSGKERQDQCGCRSTWRRHHNDAINVKSSLLAGEWCPEVNSNPGSCHSKRISETGKVASVEVEVELSMVSANREVV